MSLIAKYCAPWKGINTSVPDNHIEPNEAAMSTNFTRYEGRLQQPFYYGANLPTQTPDHNPIEAVFQFVDPLGVARQGIITKAHLYEIVGTAYSAGIALPATGKYLTNIQVFQNRVFFVNGSQYVLYWDGGVAVLQATDLFGARYIVELAGSLVIAWTVEGAGEFNQRVRWCVSGNFTQWDPGTYVGAGFNDLLECPDGITGVLNTSPVAYILRDNGITQMIPTGVGTSPFNFNHLWASLKGIGNQLHNVSDNFGAVGFVVSSDDIYTLSASSYQRIATKVKNALYNLLQEDAIGWVEPVITQYAPYLRYRLAKNDAVSGIDIWSFSTEDFGWEFEHIPGYTLCGKPYYLSAAPSDEPTTWGWALPVRKISNAKSILLVAGNPGSGINPVIGSPAILGTGVYVFKTESDDQDRSYTIRQVKVRYRYQNNPAGKGVPVTVSVQGMYGNASSKTLILGDPIYTKQQLGGALPPSVNGKYYNAYFAVPLTDQEFQVTLTVTQPATGYNSIEVSDVCVFGDVGKEVVR